MEALVRLITIVEVKCHFTERAVNSMDSVTYFLAKSVESDTKIFESKQTDAVTCNTYGTSNLPIFLKIPL